jgi:rubrerythrin
MTAETPGAAAPTSTPAPPDTLEAFMSQALAMEIEAGERYAELADAMEVHNNREVAELFRKMSAIEGRHAEQIMAEMGWKQPPPQARAPAWQGFEAAETVSVEELHYRMQPWHALQLALKAETRAAAFFGHLAAAAAAEPVRKAALELQQEETEHVALIQAWIAKVPPPDGDWEHDPDPPRYDE